LRCFRGIDTLTARTIVALAVALGALLAGTTWYVHRSVDNASRVLVQGQAAELMHFVHRAFEQIGRRPRPGEFDELLKERWPHGLRYVAVLGPDGLPEVSAGTPAGPITRDSLMGTPPMEPLVVSDRVRVHSLPPPGPPPEGATPPPPPGAPWTRRWLKVSEKGGVSASGLGRFPVTLYKEQWTKLLDMADDIRAFFRANDSSLKTKS